MTSRNAYISHVKKRRGASIRIRQGAAMTATVTNMRMMRARLGFQSRPVTALGM